MSFKNKILKKNSYSINFGEIDQNLQNPGTLVSRKFLPIK